MDRGSETQLNSSDPKFKLNSSALTYLHKCEEEEEEEDEEEEEEEQEEQEEEEEVFIQP